MAEIKTNFGSGGANLTPSGGSGEPSLADALRDIADDLAEGPSGQAIGWDTGVAVSSDAATLGQAGDVIAVEATTGSSTGPKQQVRSGSPAAGEVDVQYDGDGIPTLTFNATDAITECAVTQLKRSSGDGTGPRTTKG